MIFLQCADRAFLLLVLLLALGTVHDQPELDLLILSLGFWELS